MGADGTPLSYNLFAYCGSNPVTGYDPTGHWDWGLFGKIVATTVIVGLCLTGVGFLAAAAATVAATSVTAAVTTAVATAGISTVLGAVDGAICAEQSGGNWYDGAMAGAIGSSVGALASAATSPRPGSDSALRMNTLGRAISSYVYDLTYELFDTGSIKPISYAAYAIDVGMDVTLAPMYYYYTGSMSNGYLSATINGLVDAALDIFQTEAYFS